MKTRRLLALVLAATMVMGLSVTASASATLDGTKMEQEVTVTQTTTVPIISITVPTTAAINLNPYKLDVQVGTQATDLSTQQVISEPMKVKNGSNVPIIVSYTAKLEVPQSSKIVLATSAPAATVTTKSAYIFAKAAKVDAEANVPAKGAAIAYDKNDCLVLTAKEQTKSAAFTLPKVGGTSESPVYSFGYVAFGGSLATKPTEAWAATDTVNVTLKFSFVADANTTTTSNP